MIAVYRAEGDHSQSGYAGRVDVRTGLYFGTLDKAVRYLTPDRHLYVTETAALGNPEDHVLVTEAEAAAKRHSTLCPCGGER